MFKGFIKEFQDLLEESNQVFNKFTFSFADLELVEKKDKRIKCRIISGELGQKLYQICSEGKSGYVPPIKYVAFNSFNWEAFLGDYKNPIYSYWLKVKKEKLKKADISLDGTLTIDDSFVSVRPVGNFGYAGSAQQCFQKTHQIAQARSSALTQINNTIQEGNIDLTELMSMGGDYYDSYIHNKPDDCLHCPYISPDEVKEYYKVHINKCIWRPDRVNEFKDNLIARIQRKITEFNNYKTQVIQEIITYAQNQGLTEAELNTNRPNWQDHLCKLTNQKQVVDYQKEQLEIDINNLVEAKNKPSQEQQQAEIEAKQRAQQEEERLKKEREEKENQESEKKQELNQKREQFIAEITTALNQEPLLANSDLSPQYQNWEERLSQLTDLQQMSNLQERILADVQARRQDKISAQRVQENLTKAQTGTKEEQQQAWQELENQETEQAFQDNQEQINNLKKDQATENPQEYGKKAQKRIEQKLKDNQVKEDELDKENQQSYQKLKDGQIQDPDQLVTTENKIKENIYQVETQKKIDDFTTRVNQVLKERLKSQVTPLKKELLAFISSSNVYYTAQKKVAQNLLTQLEKYQNQSNSVTQPNNLPWQIVVPLLLMGSILVIGVVAWRVKKLSRRSKQLQTIRGKQTKL